MCGSIHREEVFRQGIQTMHHGHGRKTFQKEPPVRFGKNARIEKHEHALVLSGSNQATEALFQLKDGPRDLVSIEGVFSSLGKTFTREAVMGSLGTSKGSLSMSTQVKACPGTSMPSQKE